MVSKTKQYVGAIITNRNRDKFFVQKKDEKYQFAEFIGKYSLFGGEVDYKDRNEYSGLVRELKEEIPEVAKNLVESEISRVDSYYIQYNINNRIDNGIFHLYEIIVEDELLEKAKRSRICEGYGEIKTIIEVENNEWIWDMKRVVDDYLIKRK